MKKLLIIAAVAVATSFSGLAQGVYHSESLLATNLFLNVFPTNFTSASYFISPNPNIPNSGNGVFTIGPAVNEPAYATAPGVTFQLAYTECAYNTATNPPSAVDVTHTNVAALFALYQDDASYKEGLVTTNYLFSGSFNVVGLSTNVGTYWNAIMNIPATNFLGCKYGKLIGLTFTSYTNGLVVRSFRAGYAQTQAQAQ